MGRQHPGRCLGRAHAHRPIVDDLDRGAAPRELVGHSAADDAGADDDDVRRPTHEALSLMAKSGNQVAEVCKTRLSQRLLRDCIAAGHSVTNESGTVVRGVLTCA